MQAFYRPSAPVDGVNDVSTNTGDPVPSEELQKLGIKLSQVGTGPQGLAQAKANAQQSGDPIFDEINLDLPLLNEDQFKVSRLLSRRHRRN